MCNYKFLNTVAGITWGIMEGMVGTWSEGQPLIMALIPTFIRKKIVNISYYPVSQSTSFLLLIFIYFLSFLLG